MMTMRILASLAVVAVAWFGLSVVAATILATAIQRSKGPLTPQPEDGGCDVCNDPTCYRNMVA